MSAGVAGVLVRVLFHRGRGARIRGGDGTDAMKGRPAEATRARRRTRGSMMRRDMVVVGEVGVEMQVRDVTEVR